MIFSHASVPRVIFDVERMRGQLFIFESDCACPLTLTPRHLSDRLASSSFDQVLYQIPVAQIPGPGDFTILASTHAEAGIVLVN
ncbi:MAG: hypothetical protein ONB42_21795, partial [candidate division KSB1 bacterium]|nr:hypothetical protein [candidate division KSB1 bacterium]